MENKQNKENMELDLRQIAMALLYKAWLIVLVGILGAILAFGYVKLTVAPTYSSSIQLYVNNNY